MHTKLAIRLSALMLTIMVILVMISGCICCGPGTGKFVFLDRQTDITTKIVNGSDPWPQPISSGSYSYNESSGKIWLLFPEYFYNSYLGLKVVYGDTAMTHGDVGVGGHIWINYIQEYSRQEGDVQINGADGDGTVHFKFKDQDITLKPGESWTGEAYSTIEDVPGENGTVRLNFTKVDTFTNYGLKDISSIEHS